MTVEDIEVISREVSSGGIVSAFPSCLVSTSPPFPDYQQMSLPVGTQKRSWKLNEGYFL